MWKIKEEVERLLGLAPVKRWIGVSLTEMGALLSPVRHFWQAAQWAGDMGPMGIWLHPLSRCKQGFWVQASLSTVYVHQLLWLYPKEKLNFCSDLFLPTSVLSL